MIERPKTAPSTSRNEKILERELTDFTKKPGISVNSDVASGRRSHLEYTNDQLRASNAKASLQSQSLGRQPTGPKSSQQHYRKVMRSKSLDEQAVVGKIGSQQESRKEAIGRPNRVSSTLRNKKIPDCNLTGFTRKPGIKFKSGVKRKGSRSRLKGSQSHLENTSE